MPRPRPFPPEPPEPARFEMIRVGPTDRVVRAHAFHIASAVRDGPETSFAHEFAVRPNYQSAVTGGAGWEEVTIPLRGLGVDGLPSEIHALVYYPAGADRLGRLREGEGVPYARAVDGHPVVLLAHGLWPDQLCAREDPDPLDPAFCDGSAPPEDRLFTLFRSTQRVLARSGYVSIAPDLRWRDCDTPDGLASAALGAALEWLLERSRFGTNLRPGRIGVVGHSLGAFNVLVAAEAFEGVQAVVLLGPSPRVLDRLADLPTLVVGGTNDTNGAVEFAYRAAGPPKHVVFTLPQSHYAFFDEMCSDRINTLSPAEAAQQRRVSTAAVKAFFDRYLRENPDVPRDLGLSPGPGVEKTCLDVGDGEICAP